MTKSLPVVVNMGILNRQEDSVSLAARLRLEEISALKLAWEKKQKPNLTYAYLRRKKAKVFEKENKEAARIVAYLTYREPELLLAREF